MDYDTFKNYAIQARGIYKYSGDVTHLIRKMSMGNDVVYSMLYLWVCKRDSIVYKESVHDLFEWLGTYLALCTEYPELCIWDLA